MKISTFEAEDVGSKHRNERIRKFRPVSQNLATWRSSGQLYICVFDGAELQISAYQVTNQVGPVPYLLT